ncbi:ABC transporter permease [Rarobacter faecitabidus]|uniref:D-methionine transport system permease protein n=1 Tax=Rarobacter faecitabidus TaxID=13243 RepID=A0A542ZU31_RARFA|nr:ABC transporter permease subunit [Rarobacter faecitabidus]TQL63852.1 D-methionine transport system permease protein [Rarobacter faecitabidus]
MTSLAVNQWDWDRHTPQFVEAIQQTLQMVSISLLIGGALGLILGLAVYATRRGGLFQNRVIYAIINFLINFIRPIPFIIFLAAIRPLTQTVMGTGLGTRAMIFPMAIMCTVATARIVEQNLVATPPGVVEAGRAMGASRLHVLLRIVVPESLGPLVLGYAFLFVGVVDMSAMAGMIGGGGLGAFAIQWGYQKYNDLVTWVAVGAIIIIVQIVQGVGNGLARKLIRH